MISSVYGWFSVYLNDVLICFFHAKTVDQLDQRIRPKLAKRLQNIDVHGLNDVLILI